LVAILDADKEGFLRSETALVQTIGRAARHVNGRVIMYADVMTKSINAAIRETNRRREIQKAYNEKHGITPEGIIKAMSRGAERSQPKIEKSKINLKKIPKEEYGHLLKDLNNQMDLASRNLEFEKAAELRDLISQIKSKI
jgi:excinuclease ABC subunit B